LLKVGANPLDELPLQVWTARTDGSLDFVNAFTLAYFRVDREKLLDEGWKDVCHSLDLISAGKRWQECLASGEDYEVRFRLLRGSDMSWRWHVARAIAVRGEDGTVLRWVGSNSDIDAIIREQELAVAQAERRGR
jgi:PAS domain-containing protein